MKKNKIKIIIYRFTGKQGLFTIPKDWCEECDILISLIKNMVKESKAEDMVKLIIRPWFLWAWLPFLRYLAWHAPILIINKRLISQGIVPRKKDVAAALEEVLATAKNKY